MPKERAMETLGTSPTMPEGTSHISNTESCKVEPVTAEVNKWSLFNFTSNEGTTLVNRSGLIAFAGVQWIIFFRWSLICTRYRSRFPSLVAFGHWMFSTTEPKDFRGRPTLMIWHRRTYAQNQQAFNCALPLVVTSCWLILNWGINMLIHRLLSAKYHYHSFVMSRNRKSLNQIELRLMMLNNKA